MIDSLKLTEESLLFQVVLDNLVAFSRRQGGPILRGVVGAANDATPCTAAEGASTQGDCRDDDRRRWGHDLRPDGTARR